MDEPKFLEAVGALPAALVLGSALALPVSLYVARRYRLAVGRLMVQQGQAESDPPARQEQAAAAAGMPPIPLRLEVLDGDASEPADTAGVVEAGLRRIAMLRRRGLLAQLVAGAAHAMTVALLYFHFMGVGRADFQVAQFVFFWAVLFAPAVIAGCLVMALPFRGMLLLTMAYSALALLAHPGTGHSTFRSDFGALAGFLLAAPTLLVAAFLNRRLRTTGPPLLLLTMGISAALVLGIWVRRPFGAPVPAIAVVGLVVLLAVALLAYLAAMILRLLARLYAARRTSELLFTLDVHWLVFTFYDLMVGVGILAPTAYHSGSGQFDFSLLRPALWVLLAFPVYRLVATLGWGWVRRASAPPPGRTLLLLRVFGFKSRSERLLETLGARWRLLGGIHLIAAPDLAVLSLELPELLDFLTRQLARSFVASRADLDRRVAALDPRPDPDGRYRVAEFFCHNDTWRPTMARLAVDADAVLMDLRGFTPQNRGCLHELQQLVDTVPLRRIVLLVEGSTDLVFLERSLQTVWGRLDARSPARDLADGVIRILRVGHRERRAVRRLLQLLLEPAWRERSLAHSGSRPAGPPEI